MHTTERTVAFRDLNAQAPTHVLVVPKDHYANAAELAAGDPGDDGRAGHLRPRRGRAEGHDDYRLVLNTGPGAGQSVFHTHLHLLGGRSMAWPPG